MIYKKIDKLHYALWGMVAFIVIVLIVWYSYQWLFQPKCFCDNTRSRIIAWCTSCSVTNWSPDAPKIDECLAWCSDLHFKTGWKTGDDCTVSNAKEICGQFNVPTEPITTSTTTTTSSTTTVPPNTQIKTYSQNMSCDIVNFTLKSSMVVPYNSQTKLTLYYDGLCYDDFKLGYMRRRYLTAIFSVKEPETGYEEPGSHYYSGTPNDEVEFEYISKSGVVEGLLYIPTDNGYPNKGRYQLCAAIVYYRPGPRSLFGFWITLTEDICNYVWIV